MLEIKKTAIVFDEKELMKLEEIIIDQDEAEAQEALVEGCAQTLHYSLRAEGDNPIGMLCGSGVTVFIEPYEEGVKPTKHSWQETIPHDNSLPVARQPRIQHESAFYERGYMRLDVNCRFAPTLLLYVYPNAVCRYRSHGELVGNRKVLTQTIAHVIGTRCFIERPLRQLFPCPVASRQGESSFAAGQISSRKRH